MQACPIIFCHAHLQICGMCLSMMLDGQLTGFHSTSWSSPRVSFFPSPGILMAWKPRSRPARMWPSYRFLSERQCVWAGNCERVASSLSVCDLLHADCVLPSSPGGEGARAALASPSSSSGWAQHAPVLQWLLAFSQSSEEEQEEEDASS